MTHEPTSEHDKWMEARLNTRDSNESIAKLNRDIMDLRNERGSHHGSSDKTSERSFETRLQSIAQAAMLAILLGIGYSVVDLVKSSTRQEVLNIQVAKDISELRSEVNSTRQQGTNAALAASTTATAAALAAANAASDAALAASKAAAQAAAAIPAKR